MGFDIKDLHIDDDSPEGRALKRIIAAEDVTPNEAMWGLFSRPEDLAIFEAAMESIKEPENVWA